MLNLATVDYNLPQPLRENDAQTTKCPVFGAVLLCGNYDPSAAQCLPM